MNLIVQKFIDIMWYQKEEDINFEKVLENQFLNELYNAKGYLNTIEYSNDFDLDILILINKHEHKINASLDFEFTNSCKHFIQFLIQDVHIVIQF